LYQLRLKGFLVGRELLREGNKLRYARGEVIEIVKHIAIVKQNCKYQNQKLTKPTTNVS
jgi:hypothetical protein